MSRTLPDQPNVEQLKNQAKDLLRSHSSGDPSACGTLRHLNRFSTSSDTDILSSTVKLHEAQFALAMDYGFPSWNALVHNVELQLQRPTLTRTGNEVHISGVDPLGWGRGMECSYVGAMTVAARAMGRNVTYDHVMGVSGAAFKVQVFSPEWCPSAGDPTCGFDCCSLARHSLGFEGESLNVTEQDTVKVAETTQRITESINSGRPVLAIDLVQTAEWGIITGYRGDGSELLCRTYFDSSDDYSVAQKWPWLVLLLSDAPEPPKEEDILRSTLSAAVEMAATERYDQYVTGFAAYRKWADDLCSGWIPSKPESDQRTLMFVNAYIHHLLVEARLSAARFLRAEFSAQHPEIVSCLHSAAGCYDKVASTLLKGVQYSSVPWQVNRQPLWSEQARRGQAEVLREAASIERQAVDKLSVALRLMG